MSEEFFNDYLDYDVMTSTFLGCTEHNHIWNSNDYFEKDPALPMVRRYKKKLTNAVSIDHYDDLAKKNILYDIDFYLKDPNDPFWETYWGSLFSEPEAVYETIKEMPRTTKEDIKNIILRMEKIPKNMNDWVSCLREVEKKGYVNAKLRVGYVIDVINHYADGKFPQLVERIDPGNKRLANAAKKAQAAYEQLGAWMLVSYLPGASDDWRIGEKRYVELASAYAGTEINPREIYEWGYRELEEINKQMWIVAKQINPKAKKLIEIRDTLNNDPKYIIHGVDNFKAFLEGIIKKAIKDLHGVVFDIPKAARDCRVVMDDDTIDESPYYFVPSDDLTVPGRTIYPTVGRQSFSTWENYSTWFHESVPGHHMQFATAILKKDTLSKWQRQLGGISGYSEGWALYSERLMDELGQFDDPGYKMGYLMCQAMRAARLVVDIGLHLGYEDEKGKVWTPESAVKFLEERALLQQRYAESEVKRYISWAGQALSYKLGEKAWLEARAEAQERLGDKFNLKKFHMHALRLGPMDLATLKEELAKWNGK